ncbi:MAG: GNAT family N-acetyltransferase [Deltaproteobacteria bacterium]|nr:GNAT family N-acetyltransferase [Deltaproteobacteria bacterium]
MIFRTPIETSRLRLQNESSLDFERFYSMTVDPEVMQYIGDGSVYRWTRDVASAKYGEGIVRQENDKTGNLAVYRKDESLYIGWCGVTYSKFLDHIELGYRYCRDSWSRGYATEAGRAVLSETYRVTDIDKILACVHPENISSIRVLEKLGFHLSHTKFSNPIKREMPVFGIDRAAFEHNREC